MKGHVQGAGGDGRGQILEELVVLKGELDEVLGQVSEGGGGAGDLGESLGEAVGGRDGEVELKGVEHDALHSQDLLSGVSLVGDVNKVTHLRGVDLLVLGGDEHGGTADQLELGAGDSATLEESIDDVDGQVKRLFAELELEVDLDQPVDENLSHFGVDIGLLAHVVGGRSAAALGAAKVGHDILNVIGDHLWVVSILGIDGRQTQGGDRVIESGLHVCGLLVVGRISTRECEDQL